MKRLSLLLVLLLLVFSSLGAAAQGGLAAEPLELELVLNDFESGVPFTTAPDGSGIGLIPWGDVQENIILSARQIVAFSPLSVPGMNQTPNTVLAVDYEIGGWGGYTYAITDGVEWLNMDWTPYNALSMWIYGNNTGGTLQVDLFDNRAEGVPGDTAERYYYRFPDSYTGWRQLTIPFALFQRRTDFQPGSAPNDGLGLDAVTGYAIGFPVGTGAQTAYVDQVGLTTVEDESAVIWFGAGVEAEAVSTFDESITWDSREWELIWSDEFDGEAGTPINPEFWSYDQGGQGWGNNQLEYDSNRIENVSLDGEGNLAITAIKENLPGSRCHYGPCEYTSARILTRDKVEFTYGRVEARIRIPTGQGIWPAFWMLGANFDSVGWPNSGEIDIMENVGHENRLVHGTVHGPGYSGGQGRGDSLIGSAPYADDFHVYAIDWDPDAIRWYVDGEMFFSLTPDDLEGRTWVFDHDFFILLNVAVGGNWPGNPNSTTVFPQTMLVDYVRVYQLAGGE